MEVMDTMEIVAKLETDKCVKYGHLFAGLTYKRILWKLVKFNKHNDTSKTKQYLLDGYYFGIYIGQALMMVSEDDVTVDFTDTERRSHDEDK